ncbi:hypothetical protein KKA14_05095 [bacterium]|nr:hypothetical protein [bacterium]
MNFPQKHKNRRVLGAELIVTGGVTMFLSWFLLWTAPIGLGVYGLYSWLVKKSSKDGLIFVASGIALFAVIKFLNPLIWIIYAISGLIIVTGSILLFVPKKKIESDIEVS